MMRDMQRWLRGIKVAGRDLPRSQEELLIRFQQERPMSKEKKNQMKNKQHMPKKKMWNYIRCGGYANKNFG